MTGVDVACLMLIAAFTGFMVGYLIGRADKENI